VKPCQDFQETLLLDVYGELAPPEREAWERHLGVCEGCRRERERLHQFLRQLKEAMPAPSLSPEKARALADSILKELKTEGGKKWWKASFWRFPNRLVPAIAAVCLMILVLGWLSMREVKTPSIFQAGTNLNSEQQMIAKDLEVIRNLELLEEMEVLEKLVRVVDERNAL
jgi:anti-sigma factor RsiW